MMIVDFRETGRTPQPIHLGRAAVEVISSFKYLGVHISDNLTWNISTAILVKKAHRHLHVLRCLRDTGHGTSAPTSTVVW